MKIILTDKIAKLGEIGDIVEVNSGYARNFLIPKKKAMFASDENLKYVESKKAELAIASADEIANAQVKADAVSGLKVEIKVQVTDEGALYGSVGTREISDAFSKIDQVIDKSVIQLPDGPLKELGDHSIKLLFHPEVSCTVEVLVKPE
ncbi:MAG: 50S ribosomal protein L9 [Gammaproteobacteria bacterium]|nr:50S ribosomal protein L9 [Gammaproteobacteria bacterium]